MINHLTTLRGLRSAALATALLAGTALSASAATITFDFTSSGGTASGSGYSNQRVYSSGGVTLTVTAWSVGADLDRANVGQYGGAGLGVCSAADGGSSCSSPDHQVDNTGAQEFVLFQFSVPVDPTSVVINPYGTYDRDVRYYVGAAATTLATVNGVLPSALGTQFDAAGTVGTSSTSVAINGSTSVYTLLVGAPTLTATVTSGPWWKPTTSCPTGGADCDADYWKIESLTINYTAAPPPPPPPPPGGAGDPVPAPGALALFGAALAGLAVTRRRRG